MNAGDGKKKKHMYCLGCFAAEMLVPSNNGLGYYDRIGFMRSKLKHWFKIDYDACVSIALYEQQKVEFPLYTQQTK